MKAETRKSLGADNFAQNVAPVIASIQRTGITSLRGLARELDAERGHSARRPVDTCASQRALATHKHWQLLASPFGGIG
jgi:hypothetical protein